MPRRPKPLDPNDGAGARFSLELRALRDKKGDQAPSVHDIAERTGVSKSAMFAALGGRIPNRGTLEVLVAAWGGDTQEWLSKRRAAEAEVEKERRSANRRQVTKDVSTFRASELLQALTELRSSADNPSPERLAEIANGVTGDRPYVDPETLAQIFNGYLYPRWSQIRGVVYGLNGDAKYFYALWKTQASPVLIERSIEYESGFTGEKPF